MPRQANPYKERLMRWIRSGVGSRIVDADGNVWELYSEDSSELRFKVRTQREGTRYLSVKITEHI